MTDAPVDTRVSPTLISHPATNPFAPSADVAAMRRDRPLARMIFPDGHLGWIATSHALVRSIMADKRFSARSELIHLPIPGMTQQAPAARPGMFISMDPPEHTRYRSLLTGQFTVRRMRLLTERVEEITAERLEAMVAAGPGCDLVGVFAFPIPALVISELLGVPAEDRGWFQERMGTLTRIDLPREEVMAAMNGMQEFMGELVDAKRVLPTDDVLSDLVNHADGLSDEELANIGFMLLGAGFETTGNMLAMGTLALLRFRDQWDAWRADAGLTEGAVEELLRFVPLAPGGVRAALEDVELDGEVVAAGESVMLSAPGANRDPAKFADPDVLDVRRQATGHVSFGHGIHQCLGQQLARVEMTVAFPALMRRLPSLRLAVGFDEVEWRTNTSILGVRALPVAWDD
ncbi:cytochrome P450 [Stackebrandtia sp.]|jgi:cytochrome P450|uniref:cytochrome P450 n=1 Tax=Stackebrandtia sp. TaxID=2023065 RepID=UPI0039C9EB74